MNTPLKILWASPNTLLDTANGAALMIRECLKRLRKRGCEIRILGGTTFVNPRGISLLKDSWENIVRQEGKFLSFKDGNLDHLLMVTKRTERRLMLSYEEKRWFDHYCQLLDQFQPDIVLFFDNTLITLLTASEAKLRGIPVGVFLMHGNNTGTQWCRDVSLMVTDTKATADMYQKREGYSLTPVGTFIDPAPVKATTHHRRHILFVNPIPQKGAIFVIQLALMLEKIRPDIKFEIVDTRGTWKSVLERTTQRLGNPRSALTNVVVTPNTADMKPAYGRARLLLVPSLWWESGPRVIVEALLNGIPVIGTQSGGIGEVMGKGGFQISLPPQAFEEPFSKLFPLEVLSPTLSLIAKMYDNPPFYESCVANAFAAHAESHDIEKNTSYLLEVIRQCVSNHKGVAL